MLEKLTRNARKTIEKQQTEAMQHYLDYLKSDGGAVSEEESQTVTQFPLRKWPGTPVMYPPFED